MEKRTFFLSQCHCRLSVCEEHLQMKMRHCNKMMMPTREALLQLQIQATLRSVANPTLPLPPAVSPRLDTGWPIYNYYRSYVQIPHTTDFWQKDGHQSERFNKRFQYYVRLEVLLNYGLGCCDHSVSSVACRPNISQFYAISAGRILLVTFTTDSYEADSC